METTPKRIFPVAYKLMISFWFFVLVSVMVIGYFSYVYSVAAIVRQAKVHITGTVQQTRDNILYKSQILAKISDQLMFDANIQAFMSKSFTGYENYELTTKYLMPKLSSALLQADFNTNIKIYLQNDTLREVYFEQNPPHTPVQSKRFEIFHLNRIADRPWYASVGPDDYEPVWRQVESDADNGTVSLLRNLVELKSMQNKGFVRIVANLQDIFSSVDYTKIGAGSHLLVFNDEQEIVLQSGPEPLPADWKGELDRYLVIEEPLEGLNWSLTALVPLSDLQSHAKPVRNLTVVICLASFLVLALVGWLLARYFARRIDRIVYSLRSFRLGEMTKPLHYRGNDEFALIYSAFNDMSRNIKSLVDQVYVTELRKREAELETLQAQIDPHFLYNTLSSISTLANLNDLDRLNSMVTGLAKFYRLTLSKGQSYLPVKDELQHVMAYMDIQKIKFMHRLEVIYDISPDALKFDTIRLLLQPLVENVLKHAMYEDRVCIRIRAFPEGDNVVFCVIDDGVGISRDIVKSSLDGTKPSKGYGIYNVNLRIRLAFGEPYGASIYSRPGIGTTVKLVLPQFDRKQRELSE